MNLGVGPSPVDMALLTVRTEGLPTSDEVGTNIQDTRIVTAVIPKRDM